MIEENTKIYKVLSLLLEYPQTELLESLPELEDAVEEFPSLPAKESCREFLSYLKRTPLLPLQEAYTKTFDLNPSTSLNLTFHECGDSKDRGPALAHLNRLYRNAGWDILSADLPDYLPLMLEFAYIGPQDDSSRLLRRFEGQIVSMAQRLRQQASPYTGLLELIARLSQETASVGD